jgi:hypothetical protein
MLGPAHPWRAERRPVLAYRAEVPYDPMARYFAGSAVLKALGQLRRCP